MGNAHTNKWIWWDLWERTLWNEGATRGTWTDIVGESGGKGESMS
jgi:hypothetical protein